MGVRGEPLEAAETCGILSAREIEITSRNDAVDIVKKIRSKEYSAEEVTIAFCKRAAIAQQLVNGLDLNPWING